MIDDQERRDLNAAIWMGLNPGVAAWADAWFPDYTTFAGLETLLAAMYERGYRGRVSQWEGANGPYYGARFFHTSGEQPAAVAEADTLPLAAALAARRALENNNA